MKCHTVKDLLPGYIEGLTSEETNADMAAHLQQCAQCHAAYEKMSTAVPRDLSPQVADIDFLSRLKRKIRRKSVRAALVICACMLVLGGLVVFEHVYRFAIPFDAERMWVEVGQIAVLDLAYTQEDVHVVSIRTLEPGEELKYGETAQYTLVMRNEGFSFNHAQQLGRVVDRGGEPVRLVFISYYESPMRRLLRVFFNWDSRASGWSTMWEADPQVSGMQHANAIEVYYLPSLRKITNADDNIRNWPPARFDALREQATFVWRSTP
ncbi:MAG: zf-HC2 domain-containing protein [Defluviitaleaceae bacterium]|nr:zf-HC2 domain-containing protein [Defluviitaleaceae bacterium]MCL2238716.1 zf-HC2 domain-containing protein [Defluviitaleaceae bacterium]